MAAFASPNAVSARYFIRLDSDLARTETDHALLLDAVRSQTDSQTAAFYALQPGTSDLNAISVRTIVGARVKDLGVTLSDATGKWLESLTGFVQGNPRGEPGFEKFPEALQYGLKRLAIMPLRTESLCGLLTLGRTGVDRFDSQAIAVAEGASRLLTAILERDSLTEKLRERKLVERAKGILQQRRGLSEEQAYLLLRNNSRRLRTSMAILARDVIQTARSLSRTGDAQS